jgi:5-methylcytosine-specific restriction enzyme A
MPSAAPRPCGHPGCGALVRDGSGRCAKHAKEAWAKPVTATKRITGRKLQEMRKALFTRSPLCVACELLGRVTLATQRDHIKPLACALRAMKRNQSKNQNEVDSEHGIDAATRRGGAGRKSAALPLETDRLVKFLRVWVLGGGV